MQQSSTLVNIAMQKKQFINAAKQQTQKLPKLFCIGKRRNKIYANSVNPDYVKRSSYILSDATRGNGVQTYNMKKRELITAVNFTDSDNNWTATELNNANKDNAALDAHWGRKTYDYFPQFMEETVTII
jgi:Zn-dependent metalloprotease